MMSLVMVTASKHGYLHTPTDTPHLLQLQLHHAVLCLLFAGSGDGIHPQTRTPTHSYRHTPPAAAAAAHAVPCLLFAGSGDGNHPQKRIPTHSYRHTPPTDTLHLQTHSTYRHTPPAAAAAAPCSAVPALRWQW